MDWREAHCHCFFNKQEIDHSTTVGCFHCGRVMFSHTIEDWVDGQREDQTALCPLCGIDALIGDASGFPIHHNAFLQEMRRVYF